MKQKRSMMKPATESNTVTRHTSARRSVSMALAVAVMFGWLAACGLSGPATEGPATGDDSAAAPKTVPTVGEDPGSGTESASDLANGPTGNESGDLKELLTEAFKVYQAFQTRQLEMETRDKNPENPDWLAKYATGGFYDDMLTQIKKNNEHKYRLADDAVTKTETRVQPLPKPNHKDALVTLQTCTDMSKVNVVEKGTGKPLQKGAIVMSLLEMKRADGSLKIFKSKSGTVPKCPF